MHNRFGFDSDTTLSADWPLDIKTKSLRRDSSSDFTHVCAAITDERERQRQTDRQADRQTQRYSRQHDQKIVAIGLMLIYC